MTGLVESDTIVALAASHAGTTDPDPTRFRANLDVLVDAINDEARLRPVGVAQATGMLADAWRNRIDVLHWANQHPEIRSEPIENPLILTGLPRSGTTYFQYLFDSDPSMRMLRTWEGGRPCPPPGFDPEDAVRRRDAAAELTAHMLANNIISAEIAKIHLTDVDGPQECLAMLDQTFANPGMYWTFRIPTWFDRVFDSLDLEAAYRHHKLVLELLQWRTPPRRWVLKWPCHLMALNEIAEVYPDARFVVTHRDPVQVLASNCSLTHLLRAGTSEADPHEIGQQMKYMIGRYIQRLVDFDETHAGPAGLVHVDYERVVSDPETVMAEVFDALDLEMTADVRERIVTWRRENPPGKRGVHEYALDDYGLDANEVAEEYAFYIDRYDLPRPGVSSS